MALLSLGEDVAWGQTTSPLWRLCYLLSQSEPDALVACVLCLSQQGASVPQRDTQLWAHLDSQSAFSLHEGQGEALGALETDPRPLHIETSESLGDLGQPACHDVSTLTDLCSDLPELEIVSLLSEGQPSYTLRADTVFGYDHDDWLHTPLLTPIVALGLTHEQIEETLKYFCE
ncbi:Trafficking kinesin-binding protein 1 [Dissostichus eleginoides]|uniref:Trafficking kinesin-binding protein 1 n=1 Tax=Dissostichus eleginoides TaxID=100907 RepID=A0AAD9BKS4_DISEL|nr:Trafficking kinesin-binding protein 1 [Dissostichus eleginoides]